MSDRPPPPVARSYAPTALPPVGARLLAFLAIVVAGVCGGVIGYAVTDLQCGPDDRASPRGAAVDEAAEAIGDDGNDGCATVAGLGALGGAVLGAGGVAVVATLVLRAMAEWRRNLEVSDDPDGPSLSRPGPRSAGTG